MLDLLESHISRVKRAFEKYKDLVEKCREIREDSLKNLENYLEKCLKSFEENGVNVYLCKNSSEARNVVLEIIEDSGEEVVVKSKSNVIDEINLKDFLRERKIKVVESDCGDFLVDLMKEEKFHPILPAINIPISKISKALNVSENVEDIKEKVREIVLKNIDETSIGITGANFITTEGNIILVENEGNISLLSRKKTHIVITSIEKVVKSAEDGIICAKTQSLFSTGTPFTSYINIISSPSGTADIGGVKVSEMYGSKSIHLVIVDNGRSNLLGTEGEEILKCINCGSCVMACPISYVPGAGFEALQKGPRGLGLCFYSVKSEEMLKKVYMCSLCGICEEVCPLGIRIRKVLKFIRKELGKKGLYLESDLYAIKNIEKFGNPVGEIKSEADKYDKLYCC